MRYLIVLALLLTASAAAGAGCDVSCLVEKGLKGDGDAALYVARESKTTQSKEIVNEWYRIAAENGNVDGQFEFANLLFSEARSGHDCIRAVYWYQQAERNGHPDAKTSLLRAQAALANDAASAGPCSDGR